VLAHSNKILTNHLVLIWQELNQTKQLKNEKNWESLEKKGDIKETHENGSENRFLSRVRSAAKRECEA